MHPIYFAYPWSVQDQLKIELPAGFELDNAETPAPVSVDDLAEWTVWMGRANDGSSLHYKRKFLLGGDHPPLISQLKATPTIKRFFDLVHQQDGHVIVLKKSKEPTSAPEARSPGAGSASSKDKED